MRPRVEGPWTLGPTSIQSRKVAKADAYIKHFMFDDSGYMHLQEGYMTGQESTATTNRHPLIESRRPAVQKALGERIVEWRKSKGLSQAALADRCGIHRSHMGQIERGESNVLLATLLVIANKLDCTISQLFRDIA
jgi:DNA-binding XRE family transcriptional regulator